MAAPNGILNAKTIDQFMVALNAKYKWHLPTSADFAKGTALRDIWSLDVKVSETPESGVVYEATATELSPIAGELTGTYFVEVYNNSDPTPR